MASGKKQGYILGGAQIVAGILLIWTPLGVPLILSGTATIAATALTPTPPRPAQLRDSPLYGIDRFENPRGSESHVPILYGSHLVKPAVILESVHEAKEGSAGNGHPVRALEFRWMGVVAEGELADITDIRVNDREVFSAERTDELGKGNGTRRTFDFPRRWVVLGDDEMPGAVVSLDGVQLTWSRKSDEETFVVPTAPGANRQLFTVERDDKRERLLGGTMRVFIQGDNVPEFEQQRRVGVHRWTPRKKKPHRAVVRFNQPVPKGYRIRVTYDYLESGGVDLLQTNAGITRVVFGTAPGSGQVVTATYRTTKFGRLRVAWRRGTLDQSPIENLASVEQTRNPPEQILTKGKRLEYATSGRKVDNLRIGLTAPNGLVEFSGEGGIGGVRVDVRLQYRPEGADSWTTLKRPGGQGSWKLAGTQSGAMRWEFDLKEELIARALEGGKKALDELDAFERGAYELGVTRLTEISNDALVSDDVIWGYVTEVVDEGYTLPGTALLGLVGSPGRWLQGGSLRVDCVATRADLFDPRTDPQGGARALGRSSNHALAIRDLLTSSEGTATERFGLGGWFTGTDLLVGSLDGSTPASLVAFADYCDQWVHRPGDDLTKPAGEGNGERRSQLDLVLDTPQGAMEALSDAAWLGFCMLVAQGTRWRFPLDLDGDAVFAFVDEVDPRNQNASEVTLRMDDWDRTPTGIEASYWPASLRYVRDELFHAVEDVGEGEPTNITEVDLRGVSRETEGNRILEHLAEESRRAPWTVTWRAHPGAQLVEAGDLVSLRTRAPYSTGSKETTLKVRVLVGGVSREEDGRVAVRYTGRAVDSSAHTVKLAATPARAPDPPAPAPIRERLVTGVRVRVKPRAA